MKPVISTKKRNLEEDNEDGFATKIFTKYLPYWPLFVLAVMLALAAAYTYLRYATPIYEAGASVLVKDNEKGTGGSTTEKELGKASQQKKVENEVQVLQSRALMESVVKKLALYAPIMQEGKVKKADAYVLSPVRVEKQNPDSVVDAFKVYFTYNKTNRTVTLNDKDTYPLNEFVNTPYGPLKFTENKYYSPSFDEERKLYFSLGDPRVYANGLIAGLKVTSNRQSAVIELTYRDWVAQRSVNILDELLKSYQESSVSEDLGTQRSTLSYLDETLTKLNREIDSIEGKIERYKTSTGTADPAAASVGAMQDKSATDQKRADIQGQLLMLEQVERSVMTRSGNDVVAPSQVNDAGLATLMHKQYEAQMEYKQMKETMGEKNPLLLSKAEEITKMQPAILDNIRTQKAALMAASGQLGGMSRRYTAVVSRAPRDEKQLLEIGREHSTKVQSLNYLLEKRQDIQLAILNNAPKTTIVDKPMVGKDPVSPKKKLIYALAMLAGLGLCVGVITIKDSFTGKIKYRTEIEKMTAIPIIGEIAYDKSRNPLVIEKGTRSFVAEEFRKLRISLSFLGIDSSHKKLLLTSSISGEGKSFIAANLAVSISLTGKKVVLVDMDLNNPSLSKILGVHQEYGSTEVLQGEKRVDEVIKKQEEHENLYFISAGNLPENPTELLANGKVKALIDYLENNFDMVVIDTSPSVLVTDAFILSGMCDATLYVIRHDYTPKMLVKRIDENNEVNPLHNPAIVFNGVKRRGIIKNNYGYGYDYVYGNKERGSKNKKVS